ncbi:MAG: aminotransferase class V-fold PLP-dependent enzyme [Pyrinomonadaceae bacterium]
MRDETDWASLRGDFPVTKHTTYLNCAAAGAVPRVVMEAAASFYREMMEEGDKRWDEWLARREKIRKRVAEFINAEPEEIAFTTNTSAGVNLIADALEGRGDVVSCELEFPVSTLPWMHRGARISLVKAPEGEIHAEDIERALTDKTSVISLSHVQYSNGFRLAAEEIGERKGSHAFVLNASQSVGAFEVDVKRMKIDALCTTGHKWLLAGYGCGFVFLSRELLAETCGRNASWMSVENPFAMRNNEYKLRTDAAARAELGVPHFAGIFALGAAVDYLMRIGKERIERRVLELNRHLTRRLAEAGWRVLSPLRDENTRSSQTLVEVEKPARVVARLAQRNVAVTEKPQGIRVAAHFFNDAEDIERLIAVLEQMRSSVR